MVLSNLKFKMANKYLCLFKWDRNKFWSLAYIVTAFFVQIIQKTFFKTNNLVQINIKASTLSNKLFTLFAK